jgi:two-component system sensor histidine kinase SenX3
LGRGVPLAVSSPMNVAEVVNDCVARARTLHNLGPDKLCYESAAPVTITGDIDEVRAAVSNLLDNAIKYSGRDVKVTVTTATLDGKYVEVRVTDLGPGIPQTELKRIFKRFYRVPGPVAARVKGTGLGLFIVRSVAKRHRGRAWAQSEGPGRGSTFVLEFPIAT